MKQFIFKTIFYLSGFVSLLLMFSGLMVFSGHTSVQWSFIDIIFAVAGISCWIILYSGCSKLMRKYAWITALSTILLMELVLIFVHGAVNVTGLLFFLSSLTGGTVFLCQKIAGLKPSSTYKKEGVRKEVSLKRNENQDD